MSYRVHEAYAAKVKLFEAIYETDSLARAWVLEHDIHAVPSMHDVAVIPMADVRMIGPDHHYVVVGQTDELREYARDYLHHFRPAIRHDGDTLVIVPVQ